MAFHPHTDRQSERTIQTLEATLRASVLDLGVKWDEHLPLIEFCYNYSYHSSIGVAPFEALYGRKCRSLICWEEVGERRLLGLELVQITTDKIRLIKEWRAIAQSMQKCYANHQRHDLEFQVGDHVFLKVPSWKCVFYFGKKGKLSIRFIGPFKVFERIAIVVYWAALPPLLASLYNVFHVSVLRKYISNSSHVLEYQPINVWEDTSYEKHPLEITDKKKQGLRNIVITFVNMRWENHSIDEAIWDRQAEMEEKYP